MVAEVVACEFCGHVPLDGWCCRAGDLARLREFGPWHPEHPEHECASKECRRICEETGA